MTDRKKDSSLKPDAGALEMEFSPSLSEILMFSPLRDGWQADPEAKKLFQCVMERRQLIKLLDQVISQSPAGILLTAAIDGGLVSAHAAAQLFHCLSKLLEPDSEYRRLALYLPFEFLPDAKWRPANNKLRKAADRFRAAYRKSWLSLLEFHDVRANFVDGDVLEDGYRTGDHLRVVKAAHLLPPLIGNGLISVDEVTRIMGETSDQLLKRSLAEGLAAYDGAGMVDPEANICNGVVRSASFVLADLETAAAEAAAVVDDNVSDKRRQWLQSCRINAAVDKAAGEIGRLIRSGYMSRGRWSELMAKESRSLARRALIDGTRLAVINSYHQDMAAAADIFQHSIKAVQDALDDEDAAVQSAAIKFFRHAKHASLISDDQAAELGLIRPILSGQLSENIKSTELISELYEAARLISADPRLSTLVYPVFLIYGSRYKGYGECGSDADLAVFIRPGASWDDRQNMRQALREIIGQRFGEIVEFWLKDDDGLLVVIDFGETDCCVGNSLWVHLLYGSAWAGERHSLKLILNSVFESYLPEPGSRQDSGAERRMKLEQLESDAIQYRLMHGGYERIFPRSKQDAISPLVDGESLFWDPGFRRLASQLYVSRVFLPPTAN